MAQPLPTADEAFGPAPKGKPTAAEAFGTEQPDAPASGSVFDTYYSNPMKAEARILDAFGQGAKDAWGTEPLGLSQESEAYLRKAGLFNDYAAGQHSVIKGFNESLFRSAAAGLDLVNRTLQSGITAAAAGTYQAGIEAGFSEEGAKVVPQIIGYETQRGDILAEHPIAATPAPLNVTRARALKVVGEGEAGYFGTKEPSAQEAAVHAEAVKADNAQMAAENPPVPDIHAVARQVAPETFQEYDALTARRDQYRAQIADLADQRANLPDAVAAQGKIDTILSKVGGVEDRLTDAATQRLNAARDNLDTILRTDTPEMAGVRKSLMESDYRMRDLAPQVASAYRAAQDQIGAANVKRETMQPVSEPTPSEPAPLQEVPQPVAEGVPGQAEGGTPQPAPVTGPANENALPNIASDVQQKLVAAGRPAEEAQAAAAIVQAHYEARAQRFGGQLGTPQELYARDAPNIKGAGRKRALEMAQPTDKTLHQSRRASITLGEARNTIKLFKDADASSFMHETGHQWLEELIADAADERAPADLKTDAKTVRDWLGAKEGEEIKRAQHEKFARGFERYLMEGVAPSKGLASVFAKFRQWLTQIYQTVNKLRAPINDDIRAVFDRLITANPERTVIAPERSVETSMADIHDAEAEHTPPEKAGPVADQIRSEIDAVAKEKVPDVHAELAGAKAGGVAGEDAGTSSGADAGTKPASAESPARTGTQPAGGNKTEAKGFSASEYDTALNDVKVARGKAPSPRSLFDEIRSLGGIKLTDHAGKPIVETGDILQALKDYKNPRGVKRLINNETGMTPDYLREALTERGWLGRNRDVSETEINDLVDAIQQEAQGGKVFHPEDEEVHGIETHKALDEELGRAGIISSDSPHFAAVKLANWRASEDAIKFADEQEMAAYEELSRLEPSQYEELVSHGYELGSDLGAETEIAGEHRGGAGDVGEQPTPAKAPERTGTAPTGGASTQPIPESSDARFADTQSEYVDKAGNIRLDNINTTSDVDQYIKQASEDAGHFLGARRGVVSDQEVLDLASSMGIRPEDLDVAKLRNEFSPEKVVAVRKLFVQSATDAYGLSQKAALGKDADVMAYAEARSRLRMVHEYLAAITAETGRTLRAFRKLEGTDTAKGIVELMGDLAQEKTLFQLKQEAARVSKLDSAAKVSGFLHDSDKPGLGAMALELFQNWLISGPLTHMGYSVGNTVLALYKAVPETLAEAGFGVLKEKFTGTKQERVYAGEAAAQLYALFRGQRNGFQAAHDSFISGQTIALPGEVDAINAGRTEDKKVATPFTQGKAIPDFEVGGVKIPLGTIIRIPGERMVAPIHSYFRSLGYEQAIARLAFRQAMEEGLSGQKRDARIADLTVHPTPDMMESARNEATEQTLMGRGGDLTQRVSQFVNWNPKIIGLGPTKPLRFIDPFVHIASNIVEQSVIERGPLGILSNQVRQDLKGENGNIAQANAAARMAVGTALSIVGGGLAMEGLITPSAPSDPHEAAVWRMTNGMPHSARFGDMSFDLSRMGVLGFQLGIAADLYHFAESIGKIDSTKLASLLVHSFTQNFLDEGFMRGPSDLIKALNDPDRYGGNWIKNFTASFVTPFSVGSAQIAGQIDPYSREARTVLDAIIQKIPFASETLYPRRDLWGAPVPNREWFGTYSQAVQTDPATMAVMSVGQQTGWFPSPVERKIRGVELTGQQFDDYSRIAGRMARMRLMPIVSNPGFDQLPAEVRLDQVKSAITGAREAARHLMMMQYPDIPNAAMRAKQGVLTGATN